MIFKITFLILIAPQVNFSSLTYFISDNSLQIIKSDSVVSPLNIFKKKKNKNKKKPQCRDAKDNDRDGLIDFPLDPGCKNKRDNREKSKSVSPPSGNYDTNLNGRRPFPENNPWNTDISDAAVDINSDMLIASIGLDKGLHPDFGTTYQGAPNGIPFIVVSGSQPLIPIMQFLYDEESDPGPYPAPLDAPIEGGANSKGDRHVIVVDRDNWKLYELYRAFPQSQGWKADSGAVFDLNSNNLRPAGWTSADAAGLPIFPGLVKYEETVEIGEIRHALRFTCAKTRRAYVHPARHFASSNSSSSLPPMGMRVRLKSSFDESGFPSSVQVILRGLKKYGMFLADNGSDWYISGAPDARWSDDDLATISRVKGADFEVIAMDNIVTD